jgi:hypothetical protein
MFSHWLIQGLHDTQHNNTQQSVVSLRVVYAKPRIYILHTERRYAKAVFTLAKLSKITPAISPSLLALATL